jgi:transcriptional regulator with XRE-family HTH domain
MSINETQYWEAIATVIRMELAGRKMTQAELAGQVGIGREAVNDYLNGKRKMPFPTFVRIADVLGFTPAELASVAEKRIGL